MSDDNVLAIISETYEFVGIHSFLNDESVEKALLKLTSILANPDLQASKVSKHIVECQALSAKFALKATYYMGIGKDEPDARNKKNLYMTLKENFSLLADALKYIAKAAM